MRRLQEEDCGHTRVSGNIFFLNTKHSEEVDEKTQHTHSDWMREDKRNNSLFRCNKKPFSFLVIRSLYRRIGERSCVEERQQLENSEEIPKTPTEEESTDFILKTKERVFLSLERLCLLLPRKVYFIREAWRNNYSDHQSESNDLCREKDDVGFRRRRRRK